MSGLGFAVAEGVAYTVQAATGVIATQGQEGAFTQQVLQTFFRLMTGPVLHGAWAGIAGWFIGIAAIRGGARWPIVVLGLAFAVLLHGLNDVFAGGYLHLVTAGASILIFMTYLVHGEEQQATKTGVQSRVTEN
jgi:RsiW-degrading membrane proteinase PrsW (M82 family)